MKRGGPRMMTKKEFFIAKTQVAELQAMVLKHCKDKVVIHPQMGEARILVGVSHARLLQVELEAAVLGFAKETK